MNKKLINAVKFYGLTLPIKDKNIIDKKFRKLSMKYHPDRKGGNDKDFILLIEYKDILHKNFYKLKNEKLETLKSNKVKYNRWKKPKKETKEDNYSKEIDKYMNFGINLVYYLFLGFLLFIPSLLINISFSEYQDIYGIKVLYGYLIFLAFYSFLFIKYISKIKYKNKYISKFINFLKGLKIYYFGLLYLQIYIYLQITFLII